MTRLINLQIVEPESELKPTFIDEVQPVNVKLSVI